MGFRLRDRGIGLHRPYIHFHEQGSTLDIINLDSENARVPYQRRILSLRVVYNKVDRAMSNR